MAVAEFGYLIFSSIDFFILFLPFRLSVSFD